MKVLRKAKQIFTSANPLIIENGSIVFDKDIIWIGKDEDLPSEYLKEAIRVFDVSNKVILPGFVDAHTHLVFYGNRVFEFILRLKGMDYLKIREIGGGILKSVRDTKSATKQEILKYVKKFIYKFIEYGTTTIEAKSGYGLDLETEIKILETINELNQKPLTIVPTFLAHDIPENKKKEEYVIELIEYLKVIKEMELAKFVDIFCEKGVFEIDESRKFLESARNLEFKLKMHTDEFYNIGGSRLGVELGATSIDHLNEIKEEDIEIISKSNVVCVLLPSTSFLLRKEKYPPARKLIDNNCIVALGTDFNPGTSFTQNMQFVILLSVILLKMTIEEAIISSTINSAKAIGMEDKVGSLEVGKYADILVFDFEDYNFLVYNSAINNLKYVFKNGKLLFSKS
ncbi:MAG: imidazolonepropionase [candidate division WOR-3 bacterium]|nr:imidazolonepropionase [candidate division WOR-3 bacterium]MCX7947417.1 imidazolonepropionase [candidate division WOR-3 bacterium]MDW8151185.1 imidazolonepropionase [candidate division WOR-3 bacterium]